MATSESYAIFVCDCIRGNFDIRYRKMFGEYMIYVNERPLLLLCDDTVYVKEAPELAALLKDAEKGYPYVGAKEHYILDAENFELTEEVLNILLSLPQSPKRNKSKKQ